MYIQFRSIMPNNARLSKWGNSLAVRIPRAIVKEAWLAEGDWLSLDLAGNGSIVLRSRDREYSLGQLVAGIKRHNRHRETNWGARQGKES
jgi:antitoxin MazE